MPRPFALVSGAAALARGCNILAFDGTGQGAALLQQELVLRPDWEHVIGPVVDHPLTRTDVGPARSALIGLSLRASHPVQPAASNASPPDLYARTTATTNLFDYRTMPLGALLGGTLASAFGIRGPPQPKIISGTRLS